MAAPAVRRKFYASFTREAQRFIQCATRWGVALA